MRFIDRKETRKTIAYTMPLIGSVFAVLLMYLFLSHANISNTTNAWILVGIGSVYAFAAITLLVFTRKWELRSVGQLLTYIADALVYIYLGAVYLGFTDPLIPSEQNVIRALFAIGGPSIIIGIFLWYGQRRGGSNVHESERLDLYDSQGDRGPSL